MHAVMCAISLGRRHSSLCSFIGITPSSLVGLRLCSSTLWYPEESLTNCKSGDTTAALMCSWLIYDTLSPTICRSVFIIILWLFYINVSQKRHHVQWSGDSSTSHTPHTVQGMGWRQKGCGFRIHPASMLDAFLGEYPLVPTWATWTE